MTTNSIPVLTQNIRKSLREALEDIKEMDVTERRFLERIELTLPAVIKTQHGKTIQATTREINRFGIGFIHGQPILIGEAAVRISSDAREYCYQVSIEWCVPCENGGFHSGCRILTQPAI